MSSSAPTDTTFRGYSSAQVAEYSARRGGYPQRLIEEIMALHTSTDGECEQLLDLGCGPGNATRDLAKYFTNATGLDPSAEMIRAATEIEKGSIHFVQDEAETCKDIPPQSVDLITAATSAHWFDMDRFWPTAARILKPNGTVAFFTIWRIHCKPATTPHAAEIQHILLELEQETLGPYQKPANWCLMGLYEHLTMPWSIASSPPCTAFPSSSYLRQVWNPDGMPLDDGSYLCGEKVMTLDEAAGAIATISAVTRWREAHPQLALTERDCVVAAFARIRGILGPEEAERFTMVGPSVLVTVKKG